MLWTFPAGSDYADHERVVDTARENDIPDQRRPQEKTMEPIDIPGHGPLTLRHLVLDYNGTLALDGNLVPGVAERLTALAATPSALGVHVLTADTFGQVRQQLAGLPCACQVIGPGQQDQAKLEYVRALDPATVVAVGNGRNDRLMLAAAGLGLAVIGGEGAAREALDAARVVCLSILDALDLLRHPLRLVATLRN